MAAAGAVLAGAALAQTGMEFMPDGGRLLVLTAFGADPARIAEIAGMALDADEWRSLVNETGADLTETEAITLAGYLALNLPLEDPSALAALDAAALAAALPADGKDLAIAHCQSCHSLFSGYLMHDRDATGWAQNFGTPSHLEIPMTETEIGTFSHYSEFNMPLSFDEVPPEWRF